MEAKMGSATGKRSAEIAWLPYKGEPTPILTKVTALPVADHGSWLTAKTTQDVIEDGASE